MELNTDIKLDKLPDKVLTLIYKAQTCNSYPWETQKSFEKLICRPVIEYPLAPREALAILEFFGYLGSMGVDKMDLLKKIIQATTNPE